MCINPRRWRVGRGHGFRPCGQSYITRSLAKHRNKHRNLLTTSNVCPVTAPAPAAKLSPWPLPGEPRDHIHVDFAGPFLGNMWILVMDAYSKWPSVVRMPNYPTTETTTMAFDIIFTTWGCPKTIVSGNGLSSGRSSFRTGVA